MLLAENALTPFSALLSFVSSAGVCTVDHAVPFQWRISGVRRLVQLNLNPTAQALLGATAATAFSMLPLLPP